MESFRYCPWDGYRYADNDVQCFICKNPRYHLSQYEQEEAQQKKWEKILYERQPYDDNYIDETFLSSVANQNNSNEGPDYRQLISKTSDLIFNINQVVLYLLIYYMMLQGLISELVCVIVWASLTIICWAAHLAFTRVDLMVAKLVDQIKNYTIYVSILLLFAPVLQSVNQTYSDDTIYVLTSGSIIYYLFTKDYDYESVADLQTWKLSSSDWASLLFTSLLASRLQNEIQVFVMFYSSNLLFIFAQFIKRPFKEKCGSHFRTFNVVVTVAMGMTLLFFSYFLALLYFGISRVFFITFVSPLQLIWLYQYKNTIRGPWDLPHVKQYD